MVDVNKILKALEDNYSPDDLLVNTKDTKIRACEVLDLINQLNHDNIKNDRIIELQDKKIEEQKAEIKRLKTRNDELNMLNKKASIEAIKDFAEIILRDYPEMEYYLFNLLKEEEGEK